MKAIWHMNKQRYACLLNTKDIFAVKLKRTKVKFCEAEVLCIEE
jgi:hypothetical protein